MKEYMKVINQLLATLRSPNGALDYFWNTVYPKLQINAIDRKSNVNTVEVLLQNETIKDLKGKKRAETDDNVEPAKRRQTDDTERGGVMIPNPSISLGSIIKREALKIHSSYLHKSSSLSDRQRKIMTAGLSSILDLSD